MGIGVTSAVFQAKGKVSNSKAALIIDFKNTTPPRSLFEVETPLHPYLSKVLFHFWSFISRLISCAADLKVFPFSDTINLGVPRWAENRLRLLKNAEVVRLGTRSK